MELRDYGRALRRRWRILIILIVLGGLVGLALALLIPKTYQARTELFVAPGSGATSLELVQGSTFVLDRVKSYVEVVNKDVVLAPVISELGLDDTVAELSEQVTAIVVPETVVVSITVEDSTAEQSARIANAIARKFAEVAPTLEPRGRGNAAVIKISVINSASVPVQADRPVLRFNVALGLLVGLALGLALALAREALDSSLRTPRQIAAISPAPLLAQVPEATKVESWATTKPVEGPGLEALRELRTALRTQLAAHGRVSCVVGSAVTGEGRTTIATGLARGFAESGQRVCLVEADLRRPVLASRFGWSNQRGLTDVLAGDACSWQTAIRTVDGGGFDVLVAGSSTKSPGQVLATEAARRLLGQLESAYDVVIVDTPPLLEAADAQDLASLCGGTVLVVGGGPASVTTAQLGEAVGRIEAVEGRLLGFVTNRMPSRG